LGYALGKVRLVRIMWSVGNDHSDYMVGRE
jgi:hypothetical protein